MSGVTRDSFPGATLSSIAEMLRASGVDVAGNSDGNLNGDFDGDSSVDAVVDDVTHDSRQVREGTLFACVVGEHVDGHDFAADAVASGAAGLLVSRHLSAPELDGVPQIVVDDTRLRLGPVSSFVAGSPSNSLIAVGVTGTNGKTTTCAMLAAIFESNDRPTGVLGTLHGPRTTPEAPDLQRTLAGFVSEGVRAAVLEVSSHALALHRIDGTRFAAVVFTNLGHDHLDLHGNMEEYFRAKASLFSAEFAPLAIINADDTHGQLLIDVLRSEGEAAGIRAIPFSVDDLDDIVVSATSIEYRWRGQAVTVAIGGQFNVSNSLAALETAFALGIEPARAATALAHLATVPGRFETVTFDESSDPGYSIVVDYAHTPDGLSELLGAARAVVADAGSVIVVFGCGGDRDQAKRAPMGAAAVEGADRVIITSDNPRHEQPDAIINDIIGGISADYRDTVTVQPDRRLAIGAALDMARPGDIVVIAGKGHEHTQDLGADVVAFDDRVVARSFLTGAHDSIDGTTSESTELS